MRYFTGLALFFAWLASAIAQLPPLDNSPGFFAGEWAGTGEQGSYCYLNLGTDSQGIVLIDSGAGDWLGARVQWQNQQQTLRVDKITPLPISSQGRIMPLAKFELSTDFNQSLSLTWNPQTASCQLQKLETGAAHLNGARGVIDRLLQDQK